MSRPSTRHLVSRLTSSCPIQGARYFSRTSPRRADDSKDDAPKKIPAMPNTASVLKDLFGAAPPPPTSSAKRSTEKPNPMSSLSQSAVFQALSNSKIDTSSLSGGMTTPQVPVKKEDDMEPYHFHVYSHKHNTHITCTKPNREPIISLSCGNIGFRKSRRGTFDSAYSLTKYVLERLTYAGWPVKISRLELVLQGFGQGREAVSKVLMSPEGKMLRDKIVRVADSTRIKFGGTRSEKPRRL